VILWTVVVGAADINLHHNKTQTSPLHVVRRTWLGIL